MPVGVEIDLAVESAESGSDVHANKADGAGGRLHDDDRVSAGELVVAVAIVGEGMNGNDPAAAFLGLGFWIGRRTQLYTELQAVAVKSRFGPAVDEAQCGDWRTEALRA